MEANYLPTAHLLCWLANSFKKEDASPIPLEKFLPPKRKRRPPKADDAAIDGWIDRNEKGQ
jgi:hypothetical protein